MFIHFSTNFNIYYFNIVMNESISAQFGIHHTSSSNTFQVE
jgi:hypothetical protein